MTDKVLVFTTCGESSEAERLARHLVEQKLAACVNVLPEVKSFYHWKGSVENDPELLLIIKTSRGLVDSIRKEIEKLHSYDLPELIAAPIIDAAPNYLTWMEQGLRSGGSETG